MTDAEIEARALLAELQEVIAAKDLDGLSDLFAEDVVLFGTDIACFGRDETVAYLQETIEQDAIINWDWERVGPLVREPGLLAFAVVSKLWFEDSDGKAFGDPVVFRLTCVAVEERGRLRLRHFHGSLPQE